MRREHARYLLIPALIASALLAACGSRRAGTEEAPSGPEEQAAEEEREISADILLDPAIVDAGDEDSLLVSSLIYESLVTLEGGAPAPALAISWTVSFDGLNYTFSLRPDAVFQDGESLDADAVIANFNRWFDPADPLHGTGSYTAWESTFLGFKGETEADGSPRSSFDGIEKVDDLTVLVHLNRPMPDLLERLASPNFSIASPTALASSGANYGTPSGGAVGTGPYYISSWTDDRLVLEPHSGYWVVAPESGITFSLR